MLLDKIESTVREYNYLLTSQLEEQRQYFEVKMEKRVQGIRDNTETRAMDSCIQELQTVKEGKARVLEDLARELQGQRKRNGTQRDKNGKARSELELAVEINKCLRGNVESSQDRKGSDGWEIDRLRKMMETKKEIIEQLRKENEDLLQQL